MNIRRSWGNYSHFNYTSFEVIHQNSKDKYLNVLDKNQKVKITFIIGRTSELKVQNMIETENNIHGDVLQENFVEHYANLTLKSMYMLKWASTQGCVKNCKLILSIL